MIRVVNTSSSIRLFGVYRCDVLGCPNARQALRSETPNSSWALLTACRRLSGLISFPTLCPSVSHCQAKGPLLASSASENVDIDLRKIAQKIGKILGGSGGGQPKLTQCGGPNKDKVTESLETAKKLTKKELERK